jgi:ABC-type multidrug transport system fused ATPase/permease subunit
VGVAPWTYAGALRRRLIQLTLFVAYAASLLALMSLVFLVSDQAGACQPHDNLSEEDLIPGCLGQTMAVLFWLLLAAAGAGVLFFPLQRRVSKWLDRTEDAFQRQLENTARQLSTLSERLPPTAFLKPIGDEAALALTWGSATTALTQGASALLFYVLQSVRDSWTRIPPMVRGIGGPLFTALWSSGTAVVTIRVKNLLKFGEVDWGDLNPFSWLNGFDFSSPLISLVPLFLAVSVALADLTWAVMLPLGVVFLVVMLFAFLAAAGAGTASLKAALYFRITIEAVPTGNHRLDLVDTSSPLTPRSTRIAFGELSHSALYNSPGAIDAVIEALAGFEATRRCR